MKAFLCQTICSSSHWNFILEFVGVLFCYPFEEEENEE